jgi:hypothetical protein
MKKCVMAIREIWRIRCVVYLDDLLLLHPDKNHLVKLAPQITQFLQYYRWAVNFEKSHLQLTQQFQYLGWIWDSVNITVKLPKDRHLRILKELRNAKKKIYNKKRTSVRTLATLIGMLSTTKIQFPKASLSQMPFYNSYLCQQGRMGHMDSMTPSNINRTPMVEQNYKGEQSSLNSERPSSSSSDYNR